MASEVANIVAQGSLPFTQNLSSTDVLDVTETGLYRLSLYVEQSSLNVIARGAWTDGSGAQALNLNQMNEGTYTTGEFVLRCISGTSINLSTINGHPTGTGTVHFVVESLGS